MAKNADLQVKVKADITGFSAEMRKLNADLAAVQTQAAKTSIGFKQLGDSLSTIGARLSAGLTLPIAALGAAAVQAFGEIDSMKRGLEAITGSAQEAATQFERLRVIAKLPGIGLQEAVRGSLNLQAIGLSAQRAEKLIGGLGNALASVGRGREDLEEVIRQLGQIYNRGKLTMDNFRIVLERLPQAAQIAREAWGSIDAEQLSKQGVTAEEFFSVLQQGLDDLPKTTGGIKNELENFRDSVNITLSEVGESLAPTVQRILQEFAVPLLDKLRDMAKGFRDLSPGTQNAVIGMTAFLAAIGPVVFLTGTFVTNLTEIVKFFRVLPPLLLAVRAAMVAALPELLAVGGAIGVVVAGKNLWDEFTKRLQATKTQLYGAQAASALAQAGFSGLGGETEKASRSQASAAVAVTKHTTALQSLRQALEDSADTKFADAWTQMVKRPGQINFDELASLENVSRARDAGTIIGEAMAEAQAEALRRGARQFGRVIAETWEDALAIEIPNIAGARQNEIGIGVKLEPPDFESIKKSSKDTSRVLQEVSTVINDMGRGITNVIFQGGKLGEVFTRVAREIAEALVRKVITAGLMQMANWIGRLIRDYIPSLGKALGKLGIGGLGDAAGGAGDMASKIGSTVSKVAGSTVTSVVSAVSGVVSAVSGVIGNFQQAGMNKSLDLIVKHTLETTNQLVYGLQPQINRYLPALQGIHDNILKMVTSGLGIYPMPGYEWATAGGTGGLTLQINGGYFMSPRAVDDLADEIVKSLQRRGVKV